MVVILLIIIIAYAYSTSKKINGLKEENEKLKAKIIALENKNSDVIVANTVSKEETEKNNKLGENVKNSNTLNEPKEKVKVLSKEEKAQKERENKNTIILVTGAVLIILAAIVFLVSTWNTIPNILKTAVLLLLIAVFLGGSKIAKENFKLEKTSNTFFYMAMAYIPICLFSISFFGLLGDFLSIMGEGKYLYLTIAGIITACIYGLNYQKQKTSVLYYISILSQACTVVLFSLIFETNLAIVICNLLLYNILLIVVNMDKHNPLIVKEKYLFAIIPYITTFLMLFVIERRSIFVVGDLILLAVNYMLLYSQNKNISNIVFYSLALNTVGVYFIWKYKMQDLAVSIKIALTAIYILIIYILENLVTAVNSNSKFDIVTGIITFIMSIWLSLEIFDLNLGRYTLFFLLLFAIYAYKYYKNKDCIFKYFAYVTGLVTVFAICEFFEISKDFMKLLPAILFIATYNLEKFYKLKDKYSFGFFSILKIVAYIYLNLIGETIGVLCTLAFTVYVIYENSKQEEKILGGIIPLIGAVPSIFNNNLEETMQICIMLLSVVGLTAVSTKSKKININTIFSGIYLLFTIDFLNADYIGEIIFLIWCFVLWYFMESDKQKDIFKFLGGITTAVLYTEIADELELTEYTVFSMLGYIVFALYAIKGILKKYIEPIDVIEGVTFALIYLFAIGNYSGEKDGMLFGILIVGIILFSYIKKYGTLFLVSVAAILVNVFLLTREFWFSVPWWVYLLIIGIVFITFAIKNEANEQNNKKSVGTMLKNVKDRIEK